MSVEEQVRDINYKRLRSWDAAKAILDRAAAEHRELTVEEERGHDRALAEIRKFDQQRERLLSSDAAQEEFEQTQEVIQRVATPEERSDFARRDKQNEQTMRDFFKRGSSVDNITINLNRARYAHNAIGQGAQGGELRAILGDGGASGGSLTLPTTVESAVWSYYVSSNAMRRLPTTVITRDDGAPHVVPRVKHARHRNPGCNTSHGVRGY